MNVNILIAKRGRNDSYLTCLHYLNNIKDIDKYDIVIYTYEDTDENIDLILAEVSKFKNFKVEYKVPYINAEINKFNKAKLLDMALREMRDDYDWWSLFDLDMIYMPDWLNSVAKSIKKNIPVISLGNYLPKDMQEIVSDYKTGVVREYNKLPTCMKSNGYSQKSIPKKFYLDLLKKLKIKSLYDTLDKEFLGYGGEDVYALNVLSAYVRYIGISFVKLPGAWKHIWHNRATIDQEQWIKNKKILTPLKSEIIKRLK